MIPQSSGYVTPTDPGHEVEDVRIRGIIIFMIVLIITVIVFQIMLGGMMAYFSNKEKQLAVLRPDLFDDQVGQYAGPELQDSPNRDKPEIMRAWYAQLESYGWTDPSNKVARIPIDRAMTLLAERGIEKVPANPLPYDVGQSEDPKNPEAKPKANPKAESSPEPKAEAKPEPKVEEKPRPVAKPKVESKDEVKATPAPDPRKSEN